MIDPTSTVGMPPGGSMPEASGLSPEGKVGEEEIMAIA
jgi:hypothetical protein